MGSRIRGRLSTLFRNRLLVGSGEIGGIVYSDALSPADGPASTYLAMFRHNLEEFTRSLAGSSDETRSRPLAHDGTLLLWRSQ
jgi:hypothetical protein